ncbi:MAG TPA: carboxypeptidase-like regulatory domain-containing protein, partial [Candidatus Kapabacteria bacterium]|nr:carboxypeptidase-like regulatory domain-containing protein [Candidatus Kapabacteria bacterium]
MRKLVFLAALIICCGTAGVYASTTGKIEGKVRDKKTGEGIPGVTIRLVQMPTRGAITRPTGEFSIINVPAGDYTVRASAVGYEQSEKTNVRVSPDAIVQVNFDMETKVLQGKDTIIVVAQRNPMVDPSRVTTKRQFTDEEIRQIP